MWSINNPQETVYWQIFGFNVNEVQQLHNLFKMTSVKNLILVSKFKVTEIILQLIGKRLVEE